MINRRGKIKMETVYIAGGCLWGVQHFFDTVPGVQMTEAGRANGKQRVLWMAHTMDMQNA